MQLRPEWPWIFRSMCTYLHPYHIYLHVSYILSLSLPHISLCFLCIIFITATYILYFMTTTMIVTESEVFKVHPGVFPNSLSTVQLRDWLSQDCKTIFLCNLPLSPVKWMNMRLWLMLSFHFSWRPLPSPSVPDFSSFLFVYLSRPGPPILSNVCSPNCKPWSCSFLQHYQKHIVSYIL